MHTIVLLPCVVNAFHTPMKSPNLIANARAVGSATCCAYIL